MTITLGELRTFAKDVAWDFADPKADRIVTRWINDALRRVHRAHQWDWYRATVLLELDVEVSGTGTLSLTQDSNLATLTTGVWSQDYVTEEWDLIVGGEGDLHFKLIELVSSTVAKMDVEWKQATDTTADYTLHRYKYSLPGDFKQIQRVEDTRARLEVIGVLPDKFDYLRQSQPGQNDSYPRFYTIRKKKIEFWPGPNDERRVVRVTYTRGAPAYATEDDVATEVDWDPDKQDLLERAIEVEAARYLGSNAQVPYPLASREYEDCLYSYRGDDTDQIFENGSMTVTLPEATERPQRVVYNPVELGDP